MAGCVDARRRHLGLSSTRSRVCHFCQARLRKDVAWLGARSTGVCTVVGPLPHRCILLPRSPSVRTQVCPPCQRSGPVSFATAWDALGAGHQVRTPESALPGQFKLPQSPFSERGCFGEGEGRLLALKALSNSSSRVCYSLPTVSAAPKGGGCGGKEYSGQR